MATKVVSYEVDEGSNVVRLRSNGAAELSTFQSFEKTETLNGDGGGGTSGGMEARVSRLETNVESLRKDVGDIRVDMATVKERLGHLPTKHELGELVAKEVDRAGAKTQRIVAIIGGLVAIVVAAAAIGPKLLGWQ